MHGFLGPDLGMTLGSRALDTSMPKRLLIRISTLRRSSNMSLFSPLGALNDLPHMPYRHTITSLCRWPKQTRRFSTSLWILIPCNCIYLPGQKSCHTERSPMLTHQRLPLAPCIPDITLDRSSPFRCTFRSEPIAELINAGRCPQTLGEEQLSMAARLHLTPTARRKPYSVSSTAAS